MNAISDRKHNRVFDQFDRSREYNSTGVGAPFLHQWRPFTRPALVERQPHDGPPSQRMGKVDDHFQPAIIEPVESGIPLRRPQTGPLERTDSDLYTSTPHHSLVTSQACLNGKEVQKSEATTAVTTIRSSASPFGFNTADSCHLRIFQSCSPRARNEAQYLTKRRRSSSCIRRNSERPASRVPNTPSTARIPATRNPVLIARLPSNPLRSTLNPRMPRIPRTRSTRPSRTSRPWSQLRNSSNTQTDHLPEGVPRNKVSHLSAHRPQVVSVIKYKCDIFEIFEHVPST